MKKIEILVGSNAKNSLHKKLGNYIKNNFKEIADFDLLLIDNIPFYNYEEENNMNDEVKLFLNRIKNADGVIILTPEYNNSIPGVLKNALDWASRGDLVFQNKPTFIMGITPSLLGTVRAQDHTRLILSHPVYNAKVLPGAQVLISQSYNKMDENGNLTDEKTVEFIKNRLIDFINFI